MKAPTVLKSFMTAVTLLFFSNPVPAAGQDNPEIFDRILSAVRDDRNKPTGELAAEIAMQLLGTPYVSNSIEQTPEKLRVYLDRTDCILLVELCCAFALTVKSETPDYETLIDNIREMRYRNGIVDGYASRIHYTSEWLRQNESRGILYEYTGEYGKPLDQKFSFMGTHPEFYRQLKDNGDDLEKIRETEKRLNGAGPYFSIGQAVLKSGGIDIREGDIVCFLSKTEGLDIKHVALAHEINGRMHFIHASSAKGKVVISDQSIAEYAVTGVRLARLN